MKSIEIKGLVTGFDALIPSTLELEGGNNIACMIRNDYSLYLTTVPDATLNITLINDRTGGKDTFCITAITAMERGFKLTHIGHSITAVTSSFEHMMRLLSSVISLTANESYRKGDSIDVLMAPIVLAKTPADDRASDTMKNADEAVRDLLEFTLSTTGKDCYPSLSNKVTVNASNNSGTVKLRGRDWTRCIDNTSIASSFDSLFTLEFSGEYLGLVDVASASFEATEESVGENIIEKLLHLNDCSEEELLWLIELVILDNTHFVLTLVNNSDDNDYHFEKRGTNNFILSRKEMVPLKLNSIELVAYMKRRASNFKVSDKPMVFDLKLRIIDQSKGVPTPCTETREFHLADPGKTTSLNIKNLFVFIFSGMSSFNGELCIEFVARGGSSDEFNTTTLFKGSTKTVREHLLISVSMECIKLLMVHSGKDRFITVKTTRDHN